MSQDQNPDEQGPITVPRTVSPRIQRLIRIMEFMDAIQAEMQVHRQQPEGGRPSAQGKSGKHIPELSLAVADLFDVSWPLFAEIGFTSDDLRLLEEENRLLDEMLVMIRRRVLCTGSA